MASGIVTGLAFHGRLTQADGRPLSPGNYTLAFGLHSDRTIHRASWTEIQESVQVGDGGHFHTVLGSVNPMGTKQFRDRVRWVSVRRVIDGEPTDEAMERACVLGTTLQLTERLTQLEAIVDAQAELLEKYESGPSLRDLNGRLETLEALLTGFASGELAGLRDELGAFRRDLHALSGEGGRMDQVEDRLDDLDGPDSDIVDLNERVDALEDSLAPKRRTQVKTLAKG